MSDSQKQDKTNQKGDQEKQEPQDPCNTQDEPGDKDFETIIPPNDQDEKKYTGTKLVDSGSGCPGLVA